MIDNQVRICYAILDTSAQIADSHTRELVLELNFALDSVITPIVDTDIKKLLDWAVDETNYTHLVVYASGTFIQKSYAIVNYWQEHCAKDWLASGHIMWKAHDQYPWLHEQTVAINLANWQKCGRPYLGQAEVGSKILHKCIRSLENIHDNYTPLWLKKADECEQIKVESRKYGWNLIDSAMANGMRICNIPIEIRNEKNYIYPLDNGHKLAATVKKLREKPWQLVEDFTNDTQQKFINRMQWLLDSDDNSAVFVFNTGETAVDYYLATHLTPNHIWTTASGFKSFVEWYFRGQSTNCVIHTYDRNRNSLALWQQIYDQWEGTDIYSFMKSYDSNCEDEDVYCWGNVLPNESIKQASDRQEYDLVKFIGDRREFLKAWSIFQRLEHHYHQCNLVEDPMSLARHITADSTHFLWLNNIFYFRRNILQYGTAKMRDSLVRLLEHVNYIAPTSIVHGECAQMYFGDHPSEILKELETSKVPRYHCDKKTYPTLR